MNTPNKFLLRVGGDEKLFELEHRIFNISSFLITILAAVGVFGNYFTGLHFITVALSFIGSVISGYIWYLARIKNVFTLKVVFIYLVNIFFVLGIMFFFNAGTQGAVLYLIIMLLNIFLLVVPSTYQYFVGIALYSTLMLLISIEFLFPESIIPYHSTNEMLLDHVITISYSVFFTTAIIVLFRKKHLEDRRKILLQNESLLLLNQQISLQRNELESKTKELEKLLNEVSERNQYIETLLKELNHRVKNNLQLVSSLLQKQAKSSKDIATTTALLDTKNRLLSLILLHQRLYGSNHATSIFMPVYLKELAESICVSYNDFNEDNLIYDVDNVWLDVELAISLGLITNELITNSFKHAFINVTEPRLYISFKQRQDAFILNIKDNGIGMNEQETTSGFGMELIELLTKQLKGTLEKNSSTNGCTFTLTFNTTRS